MTSKHPSTQLRYSDSTFRNPLLGFTNILIRHILISLKIRIDTRPNPFEFGTEFAPERLVDREEEVELVVRTAINRGRLFLIGPRRYGKTSILGAAEHKLEQEGIAVLR